MKAVEKTLAEIKKVEYGNLRYEFIEKVYFAKTHCIEDFSMISNIDYPTLLAWNKEFVYQVAFYLGLMD